VAASQLDEEKKQLRAWAKCQRAEFLSLNTDVRTEMSARLSGAFLDLIAERSWKHIAVFIPLPGEPDIWTPSQQLMGAHGFEVYAPRMMPQNQLDLVMITNTGAMVRGAFGVIEPPADWPALNDFTRLDAIFIPGLAFTPNGGRLGFGGGWYDRLLARLPEKTVKIGVCWSRMLIDDVPMDSWDIRIDAILTEGELIPVPEIHD
jgi:5-formyltetrahydrofolate cyclo-ligase